MWHAGAAVIGLTGKLVRAVEDKDVAHVAASVFNSAFITGMKDLLLPC